MIEVEHIFSAPIPRADPEPLLLTRAQAATMLAVCARTVDALVKQGELKAIKISTQQNAKCPAVRIAVSSLRDFVQRRLEAAS